MCDTVHGTSPRPGSDRETNLVPYLQKGTKDHSLARADRTPHVKGQKTTVRKKEEGQGIWFKQLFCMTLLDPKKGQATIRHLC